MDIVQNVKNFINTHLTLSDQTKESIKKTVEKIVEFIKDNKSLVFFALTVLFTYYMTPVSAFEYFYKFNTLREIFVEGALFGAAVLVAKNIFSMRPLTKTQDDKINYLAGLANVGELCLNPAQGFISAAATCGFVAIKCLFERLFAGDEREIHFLIPENKN